MRSFLLKTRRLVAGYFRLFLLKIANPDFKVGSDFYIGPFCSISRGRDVCFGNNSFIGRNCHLGAPIIAGDDVMVASYVAFVGGDHKFDDINTVMRLSGRDEFKKIVLGDDVWIGHGAIILHGVEVKSGAVIAAGSVVTRDVPFRAIVAGNPASVVRYRKGCE